MRRAGITNSGSTISVRIVSRHSRMVITVSDTASRITFDTTVPSVFVTAFCAPITSLLSRDWSAPVWVRVKKAMGWRCT